MGGTTQGRDIGERETLEIGRLLPHFAGDEVKDASMGL